MLGRASAAPWGMEGVVSAELRMRSRSEFSCASTRRQQSTTRVARRRPAGEGAMYSAHEVMAMTASAVPTASPAEAAT